MKSTVIGITKEITSPINETDIINMETFSGKQAGICYMKEKYFDSYVTDNKKAFKRFKVVANTGHHSIADHANVTVLFENISKMLAMLLNSLQNYCTSEKSGRYTEMSSDSLSPDEKQLYVFWKAKLQEVIKQVYPEMPSKQVEKLAMENARYFLSVFAKATTTSYTTSLRQWNYIYDWCSRYIDSHSKSAENYFEQKLLEDIIFLKDSIKENGLYVEELRDNKNRNFRFLAHQNQDISLYYPETLGVQYTIKTVGSFALLAQAQRHRTIQYFMDFNGNATEFYIPPILNRYDSTGKLAELWEADMKKVAKYIPQGTMVPIIECGDIYNLLLKCEERLCGRAQLEIAKNTEETLIRIYTEGELNPDVKEYLSKAFNGDTPKAKCELLRRCSEPCFFKAANALKRDI